MNTEKYLSLPGDLAVLELLKYYYRMDVDKVFVLSNVVEAEVDPEASQMTLTGMLNFTGEVTLRYTRFALEEVVLYPLIADLAWPFTYRELSDYLKATYGIYLDTGEFKIEGETGALADDVEIAINPDPDTGWLTLEVTDASARFLPGGKLRLYAVGKNAQGETPPWSLKAVTRVATPSLSVDVLTDYTAVQPI